MDRASERVSLIADDLGRLRRIGVEHHALDRLCNHVDTLDAMLRPTAGQLCCVGVPVLEALRRVDGERRQLRHRLGLEHV